jgi:hypothetical protein
MKKVFITFTNYNSPYNSDEDKRRYNIFKQFNSERNKNYCFKHGYEYFEVDETVFKIPQIFSVPNNVYPFTALNNNHFARWLFFKKLIDEGYIKEGDLIRHHDADVFICNMEQEMPYEKNFTYAIDSGNTHCFGAFNLKVSEFSNKLMNLILDENRFNEITTKTFFNEHDNREEFFYRSDQNAYYLAAGIKGHSWAPFTRLPNCGLHSFNTPYVAFELQELYNNIHILPVEWNVTHLLEETGRNGQRDMYDMNTTTRDKTILRHFAGGQPWLFEKYTLEYPFTK